MHNDGKRLLVFLVGLVVVFVLERIIERIAGVMLFSDNKKYEELMMLFAGWYLLKLYRPGPP